MLFLFNLLGCSWSHVQHLCQKGLRWPKSNACSPTFSSNHVMLSHSYEVVIVGSGSSAQGRTTDSQTRLCRIVTLHPWHFLPDLLSLLASAKHRKFMASVYSVTGGKKESSQSQSGLRGSGFLQQAKLSRNVRPEPLCFLKIAQVSQGGRKIKALSLKLPTQQKQK